MDSYFGPLLEFRDIKKRFKKVSVLNGVSFQINTGEIVGLLGPSGSGKTTLMKILIGMLNPNSGKIIFEGKNIIHSIKYIRKKTGFATQENTLFEELSIKENRFYFGRLYGMKSREIKQNFRELLSLLSLEGFEDTQIKHLSGGMSKRANLLVSLIHKPKLLILDEPTSGLDPLLRNSLWKYIQVINQNGTTILVTSHLMDEIEQNCNKFVILKRGVIADGGTIEDLREEYGKDKKLVDIFSDVMSQ